MNPEAQEELNRIVSKGSDSLLPHEVDFLYARRSYLNKQQKEDFKNVLKDKEAQVKEAEVEKA